ncbi:helix-turn-helix domain-containing protein [Rummeliibacillus pycnus]|uniref:helix-turn-helix domain-containing protein n=1 Tax=Rummeliibacillus pycnus TaxID=101070 RepID=UPI0037C6523B
MQPKEFGEYLRSLCKRKELTIKQLEPLSGASNAYIFQLENRKRCIPSPSVIKDIHKHLDVTYEHLMETAGYVNNVELHSFQDLNDVLKRNVFYKGIKISEQQCKLLREILDEFIKSLSSNK